MRALQRQGNPRNEVGVIVAGAFAPDRFGEGRTALATRRSSSKRQIQRVVGRLARAVNGEGLSRVRRARITIAVDAMGSDKAPHPEIEGAILAAQRRLAKVILVGPEAQLAAALAAHPEAAGLPIEIANATEVIRMDEKAAVAVRSKRDSTLRVGLRLVREGKAAGFISAGNTGAVMATAKMVLGALPGVDRPALAAVFPTSKGTAAIMVDVGANVDAKPDNLVQFAVMGEIYSRNIFNVSKPRVGLLSVGEEESKGNDLTRSSFPLLKELSLNFIGNVEGRDLYNGNVDVIVCDGFVGNVALKVSEGLVETIRSILKESLQETMARQVGYLLSRNAYGDFKKRLDYTEYGGAPLLGIKGICIVCHGSSNANAVMNAIRVAAEFAKSKINERIAHELSGHHGHAAHSASAGIEEVAGS